MRRFLFLASAAVLVFSVGGAFAAGSHPLAFVSHGKAQPFKHSPTDRTLQVLYDQNGMDSGIGVVSQNFESTLDADDAQAADDFTVPDGAIWKVLEIDVTGTYSQGTGPADSENVTIYRDAHGRPGKAVASFAEVAGADDGAGSFVITLPKTIKLTSGTYWLSVQANLDFDAGGDWNWETQTDAAGTPAVWKNPGDGFETGCKKYKTENVCLPEGQGDHMFTIKGKSK